MGLVGQVVNSLVERVFAKPRGAPVAVQRRDNQSAWATVTTPARRHGQNLRVFRIVEETPGVRSVWLEAPVDEALTWQAGQFLTCCVTVDGVEHRRAYSISSLPGAGGPRLTIKRLECGVVSARLHEALAVGDSLRVIGPSGSFVLPEPLPEEAVFVAGGAGITPIRAMIEDLLRRRPRSTVHLIQACRDREHLIFADELEQLATRYGNLKMTRVFSRGGEGEGGSGRRLDAESLLALLQPHVRDAAFFVCGPQGLMDLVAEVLSTHGVDPARLRSERFLAAPSTQQSRPLEAQRIEFTRSGVQVIAQPGQTVLDAALGAGVRLEYSCQVGGCGHCRVRVTEGEVAMDEPNCLSEAERAAGYRLACQSRACSSLRVEA